MFWTNPSWKTVARHGSFPQILGVKIQKTNRSNYHHQVIPNRPMPSPLLDTKKGVSVKGEHGDVPGIAYHNMFFFHEPPVKKPQVLAGGLLVWNDSAFCLQKHLQKQSTMNMMGGYSCTLSWTLKLERNLASDRSPCSLDMVDKCHPIVTGSHWDMALPSAYPK